MLESDELMVFVVDENGRETERAGPVQWSREIAEGEVVSFDLHGRGPLEYRVRAWHPRAGGRYVQVVVA